MINIAWSLGAAIILSALLIIIDVHPAISVPLGIVVGLVVFIFLGRKTQEKLENLMNAMQKDVQAQKLDRAIATLKKGMAFKNQHLFIGSQLNSQIGMLYYLKKDHDKALEYLKKGFLKHFVAQGMMASIYYKRKDFDQMKKTMEETVKANKKESIVYALYAYLLNQIKEREKAIEVIQKGLKKLPDDEKLTANLILLQNKKKMKMKPYGDMWIQFMLERPPRIMQQQHPFQGRMSKKSMFR